MADALKERIALLQMGAAQGKLRPEHQEELDRYIAQGVAKVPAGGIGGRVKPTADDLKELREAGGRAEAERDAAREYVGAARSVKTMGTGPWKAWALDAITPDQDGGIMDAVGATLGAPLRALVSDKTLQARDHLNTINAKVALTGSQQMKGSSSDKDTALMRLGGIGPYKTEAENNRIIKQALYDSGLAQTRSKFKSYWIGKFGSISNPSPNGMTFEQGLAGAEKAFQRNLAAKKGPPAPPPSVRKAAGSGSRVVYDINGNPIQ
jgi:hypothetical protein